jgi:hypothetical protein
MLYTYFCFLFKTLKDIIDSHTKRLILLFCLLCNAYVGKAQLFDSIRADLKKKPAFHYKFDSRSAFIGNRNANVWGIKFGIGFNKRIRFGLGYNYLKSRLPAKVNLISPQAGEPIKTRLRMRYVSLYFEYVYYRKNKWELSVPVQLGLGSTKYVAFTNPNNNYQSAGHFVVLYEPCLSVNYRVLPFLAIGTEMGLRLALYKNNQIKEQLTAPIYVFKVLIYWSDMINHFWPDNNIPKPIMELL